MEKKLKVGNIVEVQWATNCDAFICPICGNNQFCPDYSNVTMCENCWSSFDEVHCIRIKEIGKVKHNVYSKVEVSVSPPTPKGMGIRNAKVL